MGNELTLTVLVAVPEHVPIVQVAVYEVVTLGLTVLLKPVVPSFHETLPEQFVTVSVALLPEQIVGLLTLGARLELTVTVLVAVPEQVPTVQVAV